MLLCLFAIQSKAQSDQSAPNIFIITTDGFRWQELFNGADSLIIQDVGMAQLAHQIAPHVNVHGSTQMSITSAEGVALATQAGQSISEIGSNAAQVVEKVADISKALHDQSVASTGIARNVESVARMAEENCAAVAGNAATAVQLERLSADLQGEVRRFRLG